MKKILLGVGVLVAIVAFGATSMLFHTKSFSPPGMATYQQQDLNLSVEYCRPFKKYRNIFGGLIKFGEVWRTGANEATRFKTNQNILINGSKLMAGTYSLWTIPQENTWTIIFNREYGQWGINLIDGSANYNHENDVLRVEVASYQSPKEFEQFTIQFEHLRDKFEMILVWDKTMVVVPMEPEA